MAANEFLQRFLSAHDRHATIWRYMDLSRFLKMVHSASLWFSRADLFDDVFEGSISEATRQVMKFGPDVTPDMIEHFNRVHLWWKQWTFVSCWHQSERENALMWSAYAQRGVAIRTTYAKLATHLPQSTFLAPVMYKDFSRELVPEGTQIRYFVKRHYFEDEREVRAVIVDPPANKQGTEDLEWSNPTFGRAMQMDLSSLLEAIVCRPFAPTDEVEMITKVSRSAGLTTPVVESELSGVPKLN
jgi:hypothetical protein